MFICHLQRNFATFFFFLTQISQIVLKEKVIKYLR